jgi:DNA-binding NtrC family response regulator
MAKIIVIDDEPAMVEVIVTLCREKGHQVFPFNSAPKAVEQLDSVQPQVVIADIKMETMTGFDVLRHVREHHRQTAVILITAYGTVETAVEAMKMGAYDYVTKPFKIDELQLTVQRALDIRRPCGKTFISAKSSRTATGSRTSSARAAKCSRSIT